MNEKINSETGEITAVAPRPRMPAEVAKAIVAVMKQVRQLGKDDRNEHGKYAYVSVDKFYEQIGHKMAEAGLFVLMDEVNTEIRKPEGGTSQWLWATYAITLFHESGVEYGPISRDIALPISGPQGFGSGQSYVEKQFLRALFKIPTGDKDADETAPSDNVPAGSAKRPPKAAPAPAVAAPEGFTEADLERAKAAANTMRKKAGECISQSELKQVWDEHEDDRALLQKGWPKQYDQLKAAFEKREAQIAEGEHDPAP